MNDNPTVATLERLLAKSEFSEAYALSKALVEREPDNVKGWWGLTRAAKALKRWEEAKYAAKETIELVPRWPIIWGEYGIILENLGQDEQARKAYEAGLKVDPHYAYGHTRLLFLSQKVNDRKGVISHGQALEQTGEAGADILDLVANAFWYNTNFPMSLHYFKQAAQLEPAAFRYSNVGLVYERPELNQLLDALDAYRRALLLNSTYEPALSGKVRTSEKLTRLARELDVSEQSAKSDNSFFRFYVNPFMLLGFEHDSPRESIIVSTIQKKKKALIQELELEDNWSRSINHQIDKSHALSVCDELFEKEKFDFHWTVFKDWPLCYFLQYGDIRLFSHDENYFPIDTLAAIDNQAFLDWLSEPFASQFDIALSGAIELGNLPRVKALLSGHRYVNLQSADLCFSGAARSIDRRLEKLRAKEKAASVQRPSISDLSRELVDTSNPVALAPLLNLLPAHFRPFQNEAVRLICSIAIDCNNVHSDSELARDVLALANSFTFVSVDVKHQVEADRQKIQDLIAQERQHEVRLTLHDAPLNITKEGIRNKDAFVAAKDAAAIRWGINVTGSNSGRIYEFLIAVRGHKDDELVINWRSASDIEKNTAYFSNMIDAALNYICPSIISRINSDLDGNKMVRIGTCDLTASHIVFHVPGWFGKKRHELPWNRVEIEISKGDVHILDRLDSKIRTSLALRETYNAPLLTLIAAARGKSQ